MATKIKTRWYYDANTLDEKKYTQIIKEITNSGNPKVAVISHLSLGEAYCNTFDKNGEKTEAIKNFLNVLKEKGHLEIVGNEVREETFDCVYAALHGIDITDILHVATAMENKCSNLNSDDRDLNGLQDREMNKLKGRAKKHGIDNF